ncbi:hypothetical protein CSE16_06710 [Solibacillus sp. R5-41]|nr:hypothetical protein CSE16_06710 [Solibacillus sp. R5-41]
MIFLLGIYVNVIIKSLKKCTYMAYKSLFDMASTHKPTVVSPNEKIKIEYKKKTINGEKLF